MKGIILSLLLPLILSAGSVKGQVLVTYDALIVSATRYEEFFPPGERVVISYVLDAVPDSDPDPGIGSYDNPVAAMWVSFPGLLRHAHAGPGTVPWDSSVFLSNDNVIPTQISDTIHINSGPITSATLLDGHPVTQLTLEFGDYVPLPGEPPTMLVSDSLPLHPIVSPHPFLMISAFGTTVIRIEYVEPATVTYEAIVESAGGPHASLFPTGERMQITYKLGRNAADMDADPNVGSFRNAVLLFGVSFPDTGIFANAGPPRFPFDGHVFVGNDGVLPSGTRVDLARFLADRMGSSSRLNGETISSMELNFHDFTSPPGMSSMISGDDLPLQRLRASDSQLEFRTSSGTTFVNFVLAPSTQVEMLTDDINALVADGTITAEVADRLIRSLESAAASIAKNNTGSACSHLRAFVRKVQDEIDGGTLSAAVGQTLIDHAETLQDQLGCS